MGNNQESELKFLFAPEDLPKVKAVPLLKDALLHANRQRLTASYFDTPDNYLWRRGASLRIRRTKQGRVQTLKQETSSGLDRGEWEEETGQDVPDIDALSKTPLGHCLRKPRVRDRLQPNFEVDVERTSVILVVDRARIEAALDKGRIKVQDRTIAIAELELELKEGEKAALFHLARTLAQRAPIYLSFISKAERGYLLGEGAWGHSFEATQPKLAPDMSCAESFEAICRCCLHDFMLNAQALETSDRVEAVHKGRVSLRRLRAGLQLFKPLVCDQAYQRLDDDLKWMSHLFGDARDLDVFQEATFLAVAKDATIPGAQELADYTGAKRNAAHDAVNAAVKSEPARLLLVDLVGWIEDGSWRRNTSTKSQDSIEAFARKALKKRRKKLVKQAAGLADLDPQGRHRIRIKAKKLRYMVGFFKGVSGISTEPKAMKRLLRCLKNLQARLGEIHDGETKAKFLEVEARNMPAETSHIAAFAAGALAAAPRDTSPQLADALAHIGSWQRPNPFSPCADVG